MSEDMGVRVTARLLYLLDKLDIRSGQKIFGARGGARGNINTYVARIYNKMASRWQWDGGLRKP